MLFDPAFVLAEPIKVLIALGIVPGREAAVALAIVLLLRDTRKTAATVAIGLAQIGEFSFILGALGTQLGVLPSEALDALIAAALVSIAVNPLLFKALAWFARRAGTRTGAVVHTFDRSAGRSRKCLAARGAPAVL